jgi:hypothetical protein
MDNYTVSESSKMAENSSSSNETSPVSVIEEVPNDQIPSSDKGGELQDLGVDFVDQNVLERELMAKVIAYRLSKANRYDVNVHCLGR